METKEDHAKVRAVQKEKVEKLEKAHTDKAMGHPACMHVSCVIHCALP